MNTAGVFSVTHGALPAVRLQSASGASAVVTLYGAHLVSWESAPGAERLFCSRQSAMDGSKAIRGGVPVIFPQFAEQGSGMRHGFARVATWRMTASSADGERVSAQFQLSQEDLSPAQAAQWPHAFLLTLTVLLDGPALALALGVANTGAQPFAFAAALHSYFRFSQAEVEVAGLQGVPYLDQLAPGALREDTAPLLTMVDKTDRIYFGVPGPLLLRDTTRALWLGQTGFTDAVTWNPGAEDARALADMADDEYRDFICVEAAQITPVTLAAGAHWLGSQRWLPRAE